MKSKSKKLITTIAAFVLIIFVAFFVWRPSSAEAAWFDDSYAYRNAIPISSHTASENNVYITATIDTSTSGQFQGDCGDLRFTDYAGNQLPYYISSGCTTASTVVHVFFDTMPAGAQTIYYYYGNPSATNGFNSADFATQAASYAVGSIGSQEKGGAPVAYFKFDDGTGTNAQDSSPNNNDGTISGATWQTEDQCISGKCLFFDGTTSYTSSADSNTLKMSTSNWTVSTYIRMPTATATNPIIAKRVSTVTTNPGYQVQVQSDGLVYAYFSDGTAARLVGSSSNRVDDNKWHHIAVSFTRTSNALIYVDGKQVGSFAISAQQADASETNSLTIGKESTSYFKGFIDDTKIYNYARTAKQIVEDMNGGHPAGGSPVGSQVGYWRFDEGYGTTANNQIPGGPNGTITGATWNNNGKFNKALNFDGSANRVTFTSTNVISASAGTLSLWFKPATTQTFTTGGYIFEHFGTNSRIYLQYVTSGSVTNVYAILSTGTTIGTVSVTPNVWHHAVLTWDNTSAKLYIDGIDKTTTGTITALTNIAATSYIGNFSDFAQGFTGGIDEVKIYNYALTSDEVQLDYNKGAAMVLGTLSDTSGLSGGSSASSSATASYCVPGATDTCSAPMGEWNFEEGSGTSAFDSSGNGNTGTATGTTIISGKVGKARSFNGTSDYVAVAGNGGLNITDNLTLSAWIKPTTLTQASNPEIIAKSTGAFFYRMRFISGGTIRFNAYGTSDTTLDTTATLTANSWNHVEMVYNGSTKAIYINGNLSTSESTTGSMASEANNNLYIGNLVSSEYFSGSIDQVRIYNYARTQAQIAWDYNRGGPAARHKFDECQGATANDSSGNGNNGTITIGGTGTQTAVGTCTTSGAWFGGATGKYNSSLNFDGTDDYVSTGTYTPPSGDQSYSTWIKTSTSGAQGVMTFSNSAPANATHDREITVSSGNKVVFYITNSAGGTGYTITGNTSINDGNWHHIVTVVNNTTVSLYVDGKLDTSAPGNTGYTGYTTPKFNIGNAYLAATSYFSGQIDDVRIYNYALTPLQVKQVFNEGSGVRFGL
mgnify:CR=1 FL=1